MVYSWEFLVVVIKKLCDERGSGRKLGKRGV